MNYYPIHVNLTGKRCVVVGAGKVAERRVGALRAHGGLIRLVAPQATAELRELADIGAVTWLKTLYHAGHLEGAFLVVAATDLEAINATVARDAQARNLLVCRADDPEDGNYITPSVIERGALTLTVSTGGNSPTLAAVLKEKLTEQYGGEWEYLTALLGTLRESVKRVGSEAERRDAVRRIINDEDLLGLLKRGEVLEAESRAKCLLSPSE